MLLDFISLVSSLASAKILPLCRSVDPTRLLLTFNVSVNLGDKYHKNTALHWAVLAGNTTVISLLLDANANVDAQNIKVMPHPSPSTVTSVSSQ